PSPTHNFIARLDSSAATSRASPGPASARTRITRGISANLGAHRPLFGLVFSSPAATASPRTSESPRSQKDRYRSSRSSAGTRTDRMCDAPRSQSHTFRAGLLPSVRPWSHFGTTSAWGGGSVQLIAAAESDRAASSSGAGALVSIVYHY